MTTGIPQQRHGMAAIAFGLAAAALYLLMITVTLAHIQAISGQVAFDMRPFGYSPQEAARLLDALGQEGRTYYLTRQIPLDTVYPALLAMTLISAICWFGLRLSDRRFVRIGIAFSVSAAVFDYVENLGVALMILNWQDLSPVLVHATSTASIAKACLTTAAAMTTLALGAVWLRRSLRQYSRTHSRTRHRTRPR